MLVRPRIIPVLLLDNQSLVKTTKFKDPNYLGDPINAVKIFSEKCVDELCILDISASKNAKGPDFDLLQEIATEAFMPLSYGGGITTVEDAKRLFRIGYEKVIFNTAVVENPSLITKTAEIAGSQSVVVSIDYKKGMFGKTTCYTKDNTMKTEFDPITLAEKAQKLGAGEILIQSIDNDGMMQGFDIPTIKKISQKVDIPVIACSGAKDIDDLKAALTEGYAHAVSAGSMFVYYGKRKAVLINVPSEQEFINKGVYYER